MSRICVIGMWHLGCVTAASLSEMGHEVCGIDFDSKTIENLKNSSPPLYEPGLQELIKKNIKAGRLSFSGNFETAIKKAEYIFIAFDTPVDNNDRPDLKPIYTACEKIAQFTPAGNPYIVVLSQVPVGTCGKLKNFIMAKNRKLLPEIICSPENLRLGKAIQTFMSPDRIVIGAEKKEKAEKLLAIYKKIRAPKLLMSLESAELSKQALNAYLALSISFINEMADLSERSSADIRDVVRALKSDKRIGERAFLNPGLGFSGGTLARDLRSLLSAGKEKKTGMEMIEAALRVNRGRIKSVIGKLKKSFPKLKNLKGGILGLTYKPGTSTLRRSISLQLAKRLTEEGVRVKACDPMIQKWEEKKIQLCQSAYQTAEGSEFLVIATEWPQFKALNFRRIYKLMRSTHSSCGKPVIIDAKNILDPSLLVREGFKYFGTGVTL